MFICNFCQKECHSVRSVAAHQALCKKNPKGKNPADWATGNRKGIPSWNSGLVGDTRLKHSLESKLLMSKRMSERTPNWHEQNGKRIAKTIQRKVEKGTWHTSLAKNMNIEYKGQNLHGSWELKFAIYCDSNNIDWVRNKDSFPYIFEGKNRRYTPDFYLPQTDEYVEIKGYKTEKDTAKWEQFPKSLLVLTKKELKTMKII